MSGKALVTLSFDDGLDVQLDRAIPILDAVGMKSTYFVDAGGAGLATRHLDWSAAAARGHELGNHTVFHPGVSSKAWVTDGIALENYSLDRMRRELIAANRILSMLDGRKQRSFAFPCGNPWLGQGGLVRRGLAAAGMDRTRVAAWVERIGVDPGSTLTDYTPLVREIFPVARLGGIDAAALPAIPPDRHRVAAVSGDDAGLADLLDAVELCVQRQAWLVLSFHGIGGGHHMSCDEGVFREFVASLARDARVEVLTFLEAGLRLWPEAKPRE